MVGSKYTDEQRQRFAALLASGLSASAAGKELSIPKSTACAWAQRLIEESDDYAAERELEVRRMVKRCFKIARGSLGAIDKQVTAAAADGKRISEGLKVLSKLAKVKKDEKESADDVVQLTDKDIMLLREIINNYTGVGLRDLAATIKAVDEKQARLESQLRQQDEAAQTETAAFDLPARLIAPAFASVHLDVLESAHTEYALCGGRGSGKSSYISLEIINLLKNHPDMNALVLRKVGNTLRGSVFAQILWAIGELGLADEFEATVSPMEITRKATGQKILFRGADDPLKAKSVKPVHGYIGILWFEELDQFAGDEECRSLQQSAIRGGDRAYIFKSFNPPKTKNNWANKYVDQLKENRLVSHTDYRSVPAKWLGKAFLEEAEYLKEVNPTAYEHEYLGIPNGNGGMVFENAVAETITEEQIAQFDRVLNGLDWGYYPDPWAFNRCHFDAARRTLYIFDELHAYKKGNRKTADLLLEHGITFDERITADSADSKSIGDYRDYGFYCRGAEKGPGSVDYSMKWLQSLVRIVIDPIRCPKTWEEFSQYEYERTKDGEIISGYPDANNHHIDAVRYATEQIWKRRGQ